MTADDAGTLPQAGHGLTLAVSALRSWRPSRERWQARRERWRAWRRSRPFWGGLLLVLAGLELFAVPLSGVLVSGAVKLVIYIGIGGVFGVLIGALLVAAGVVVWVNPAHKMFYGIAGVVLGIVSFPASNLGGLFIGMLLAVFGGAIAVAWTAVPPAPALAAEVAEPGDAQPSAAEAGAGEPGAAELGAADLRGADPRGGAGQS